MTTVADTEPREYCSHRYLISTSNYQKSPIIVSSVIPSIRDLTFQTFINSGTGSKQCSTVYDAPGFNNPFKFPPKSGVIRVVPVSKAKSGVGNDMDTHLKPLLFTQKQIVEDGCTECSFAHLLMARKCRDRPRKRMLTDETLSNVTFKDNSCSPPSGRTTVHPLRNSTFHDSLGSNLSLHTPNTIENLDSEGLTDTNPINMENPSIMRIASVGNTWKQDSSMSISAKSEERLRSVTYEDPLIFYDPNLLDDPFLHQFIKRRVFTFSGYVTSILGYRRPNEHKRNINQIFHLRFPAIQLSLTKMRSLKRVLLSIAEQLNLDLWIVAHAVVLFEKMILKLFVCKTNRKLCAGAAMLISAKLNDIKGVDLPRLIQELETEFRICHRDLFKLEVAAFVGLEFNVIPKDSETLTHHQHLLKIFGSIPKST